MTCTITSRIATMANRPTSRASSPMARRCGSPASRHPGRGPRRWRRRRGPAASPPTAPERGGPAPAGPGALVVVAVWVGLVVLATGLVVLPGVLVDGRALAAGRLRGGAAVADDFDARVVFVALLGRVAVAPLSDDERARPPARDRVAGVE